MRSKTYEPVLVQAPAHLRANVPSYRLRAASYVLRRGYWKLDYKDKSAVHFYFVKIRANQINKSKFAELISDALLYTLQQQKTTYEP